LKLEISFPKNDFSISFKVYNNTPKKLSVIENSEKVDLNEKIIYIFSELSSYNGLVVQLSSKNNNNNRNYRKIDENNSDLIIGKFTEYTNDEEIIYNQYYFDNNSISYSSNENYYIWSVEQLKSNNSNNNYSIQYILNLYDSNNYSTFSILQLIAFANPKYSFKNYTLNDTSKMVIFNIDKNDISNKVINYNVNIIANITNNNDDYEILSAKPTTFRLNSFNYEEESSDDNDNNNKTVLIVCLVLLFVIIVTIIIVLFYKMNMKNKNSTDNHEKFHNEGNDHNNLHTEQQYINISEKPDIKKIEMNNVEHPVDIIE